MRSSIHKSLTKDEARSIVILQLNRPAPPPGRGQTPKLSVTDAAKDFIIDAAYDSVYGARPIKRFIQSRVETLLAKAILQGSYAEGDTLTVDCGENGLVLRLTRPKSSAPPEISRKPVCPSDREAQGFDRF